MEGHSRWSQHGSQLSLEALRSSSGTLAQLTIRLSAAPQPSLSRWSPLRTGHLLPMLLTAMLFTCCRCCSPMPMLTMLTGCR